MAISPPLPEPALPAARCSFRRARTVRPTVSIMLIPGARLPFWAGRADVFYPFISTLYHAVI
ncbi:hypothetical protein HMPREF3293_01448 [Christensenella minuta]|uniref:Uncharacterized protein n=1 Tax=Christensenella minuta TaxID=626937 RepID=A0A136Q5A0_9FIRM|nr:hypothetical protein HMPREF3293_01448 [Christensenella minuta]